METTKDREEIVNGHSSIVNPRRGSRRDAGTRRRRSRRADYRPCSITGRSSTGYYSMSVLPLFLVMVYSRQQGADLHTLMLTHLSFVC